MFFATPYHYTFSTGGFGITLNALGTDSVGRNYTQCFTVSGAKLYVYVDDLEEDIHIYKEKDLGAADTESDAIKANHYAAAYDIRCYPTHFTSNAKLYVYAAIPRSTEAEQIATIVYPSQRIDILGRVELKTDKGDSITDQVGDPAYYYIDLQGRITSADTAERQWENEIAQGAILGHIIGDEAGGTRAEGGVTTEDLLREINELRKYVDANLFFEPYSLGEPYTEQVEDPETGQMVDKTQHAVDDKGNPLYWTTEERKEQTTDVTDYPVMEPVININTAARLKPKYSGMFADGFVSALGISRDATLPGGSGGGKGWPMLTDWREYDDSLGDQMVVSARLLYNLWLNCDVDVIDDDDTTYYPSVDPSSGVKYLSRLLDVTVAEVKHRDLLIYDADVNGGQWVNTTGEGIFVTVDTEQRITAHKRFDEGLTIGDVRITGRDRILHIEGAAYTDMWLSSLGAERTATGLLYVSKDMRVLGDATVRKTLSVGRQPEGSNKGIAGHISLWPGYIPDAVDGVVPDVNPVVISATEQSALLLDCTSLIVHSSAVSFDCTSLLPKTNGGSTIGSKDLRFANAHLNGITIYGTVSGKASNETLSAEQINKLKALIK